MNNHIINKDVTLLEALSYINAAAPDPLVLFVLDDEKRMVGTLTDGDSRRALIAGASVNDKVEKIMHRDFNYMSVEGIDDVKEIKRQRDLKMRLVPVLDSKKHIVEIINLEKYKSRLPFDAVLMAGGKGERLRPLTLETPKPLLKVGDKCIIDHNIDRLISYGVKNITVTVNYLKELIEEHFREPRGEVQVKTVREPKYLGTIGSIGSGITMPILAYMMSDLFSDIGNTSENVTEVDIEEMKNVVEKAMNKQIKRFLIFGALTFVANFLNVCFWTLVGERCVHHMKRNYFTVILSQEQGWFDAHNAFEFATKVQAQ